MVFLQNQTTNYTCASYRKADSILAMLYVGGIFAGATVTLQVSPDNKIWFVPPNGTLTAPGIVDTRAYNNVYYQISVTGCTGTTNINAMLA